MPVLFAARHVVMNILSNKHYIKCKCYLTVVNQGTDGMYWRKSWEKIVIVIFFLIFIRSRPPIFNPKGFTYISKQCNKLWISDKFNSQTGNVFSTYAIFFHSFWTSKLKKKLSNFLSSLLVSFKTSSFQKLRVIDLNSSCVVSVKV